MLRSLIALLVVAVVGTSQGCRICDSPYDYCGPVMPCGESCGCGHGGCGHSHGGYVDSGYSGHGHGGCASCGHGGGHIEESMEYEGETIIQGQPTPAPAPMAVPQQTRRATPKTTSNSVLRPATNASYEKPLPSVRTQPSSMPTKPARMTPYPAAPISGNRMASNGKSDSGRGLIFW